MQFAVGQQKKIIAPSHRDVKVHWSVNGPISPKHHHVVSKSRTCILYTGVLMLSVYIGLLVVDVYKAQMCIICL